MKGRTQWFPPAQQPLTIARMVLYSLCCCNIAPKRSWICGNLVMGRMGMDKSCKAFGTMFKIPRASLSIPHFASLYTSGPKSPTNTEFITPKVCPGREIFNKKKKNPLTPEIAPRLWVFPALASFWRTTV